MTRISRMTLVLFTALLLQVTLVPQILFWGRSADLLLLLAIASGVIAGPDRGAMVGFAAGICTDLIVQTPFGLWALVGTLVGYAAGNLAGTPFASGPVARAVVAFMVSGAGVATFVVLALLIGQEQLVELRLVNIVLVVAVANAILSPLAFKVVRWGLEPAR